MHSQYQKIGSLTIRQLAYTLATAEEGNVSAAARKMHVSQPAISAAIAALEDHYGMKLFTRHPAQGVSLTPFGVQVVAEARLLCDQAQKVASLASPESGLAGEIGLCCYEAIAPYILPRLLRHLETTLPAVTIRYSEASLEGVVQNLQRGTTDLVITYDLGLSGQLVTDTLYVLQPHVICSSRHRFAAARTLRLSSLRNEPLILLDQPLSAQYVLGLFRSKGIAPNISGMVRGFELQRALVANDYGIAVAHTLPDTGKAYDGKAIHAIPIVDDLVEQRVLLASLDRNQERPILVAARQEIVASFVEL